jgi:hypothetical protein
MKRVLISAAMALVALAALAPAASAQFGLEPPQVSSEAEGGGDALQAGSHPYALVTEVAVKTEVDSGSGKTVPSEELKDLQISFPQGLVGNPTAVPQCPTPIFLAGKNGECAPASAVGVAEVEFGEPGKIVEFPIYNLEPSPGNAAKVGFIVEDRAPVTIDIGLNPNSPNNVEAHATNVSQALFFFRSKVTIWGNPADPSHDTERGICLIEGGSCAAGVPEVAFLTLPSSCDAPPKTARGSGSPPRSPPRPPPPPPPLPRASTSRSASTIPASPIPRSAPRRRSAAPWSPCPRAWS